MRHGTDVTAAVAQFAATIDATENGVNETNETNATNLCDAQEGNVGTDNTKQLQTSGTVISTPIATDGIKLTDDIKSDSSTLELVRLSIIDSASFSSENNNYNNNNDDEIDIDYGDLPNGNNNSVEYESGMIMRQTSSHVANRMSAKVELLDEIPHRLFDRFFKYPSACRHCATCLTIFWALLCATVTTLWCMWFDYQFIVENEMSEPDTCTIDFDYPHANYPLRQRMSYNATQNYVNKTNGTRYPTRQSHYQLDGDSSWEALDTFGSNVRVSDKFLFTVLLSYFLGVAFWHPLIVALKSMYKLHKFHKKPYILSRALLFYDSKNLVDLHEIASATPMTPGSRSRSRSRSQSQSLSSSTELGSDAGETGIDDKGMETNDTMALNNNSHDHDVDLEKADIVGDQPDQFGEEVKNELQLVFLNGSSEATQKDGKNDPVDHV